MLAGDEEELEEFGGNQGAEIEDITDQEEPSKFEVALEKTKVPVDTILRTTGWFLRYTFIPFVIFVGMTATEPQPPSLVQVFLPML